LVVHCLHPRAIRAPSPCPEGLLFSWFDYIIRLKGVNQKPLWFVLF
jgi:hypothetical protein